MSLSEKLEAARVALGKRKERERQQQAADSNKAEQLLGPRGDNRLLAGNLAHEFLTRGTLLGRRIGPDKEEEEEEEESVGRRRYAEVSLLLMASGGAGAHVPGVVNPTQLASWLRIKE